jgi:hypothetical protein
LVTFKLSLLDIVTKNPREVGVFLPLDGFSWAMPTLLHLGGEPSQILKASETSHRNKCVEDLMDAVNSSENL